VIRDYKPKSLFENIDKPMLLLYLVLVLFGWVNIYAAVFNDDHASILDFSQSYGKQMVWIITALILGLFIIVVDSKFYTTFAFVFYGINILMLIVVLFVGKEIAGSKSWLGVGDFGIQPSEFAKIATAMALGKLLGESNRNITQQSTRLMAFAIIGIPILFILLQNDTGSSIVFMSFLLVFYREGMNGTIIWFGLLAIFIFIFTLIFNLWYVLAFLTVSGLIIWYVIRKYRKGIITLVIIYVMSIGFTFGVKYVFESVLQTHQRDRIEILLGLKSDPKGVGYNVNQSKIAIGSGGVLGKGFLQGTQTKFKFVPEQSTDFIFCTVGEEWGFLGSSFLVVVFISLILRIIFLAEKQRSPFSRIYGYGVAIILFTHFMINVGMTLGLMPVIGIPLPFLSYGGSSLWSFTVLLFIFIRLDMNKKDII
jgi:rod shape determining protein RodA